MDQPHRQDVPPSTPSGQAGLVQTVRCPSCDDLLQVNSGESLVTGACPACGAYIEVEITPAPASAPTHAPAPAQIELSLVRDIVKEVILSMHQHHQSQQIVEEESIPKPKISRPEKTNPSGIPTVQYLQDLTLVSPNELPFEQETVPPPPAFYQKKEWMIAGGALAFLIFFGIYFIAFSGKKSASAPSENLDPPKPKISKDLVALPPGSEVKIGTALHNFSLAKSPKEMLPLLLPAPDLLQKLTDYYTSRPKDFEHQRLKGVTMRLLPSNRDDLATGIGTLQIRLADEPARVLVFRRELGDQRSSYLLDWESYIQEMDRTLEDFLRATGTQAPGLFRVRMKRTHVFDELEDAKVIAITLGTISGRDLNPQLILFPDHPLYSRIDQQLPWNETPLATIRLGWLDSRLRLEEFICWEMLGVARNKESP